MASAGMTSPSPEFGSVPIFHSPTFSQGAPSGHQAQWVGLSFGIPHPTGKASASFLLPNTPFTMNCPGFPQSVESHTLLGLSYLKQSRAEEIQRDYRTCFTSRRMRVWIPISLIKAWLCRISIYNLSIQVLSIQGPGNPLRNILNL